MSKKDSKKNNKKAGNKSGGRSRSEGKFHHSKKLGQNFLTDRGVVEDIAIGSQVDADTLVIEIGPGQGVLTEELAQYAGGLYAVELDDRLIPYLRTRFALQDHVEIIHGDILEIDLEALIQKGKEDFDLSKVRVVGNLPYYITTPIIMKLLESGIPFESITIMMQKEVAERLMAEPGTKNTGAITYAVQYRCTVDKICDADRTCFDPAPKVDSMVLRLNLRPAPPVHPADETFFFRCIKAGFMMRRKTLLNSLTCLNALDSSYHFDKADVQEALESCGIEANRRAESLTMEEFEKLSNAMWRLR